MSNDNDDRRLGMVQRVAKNMGITDDIEISRAKGKRFSVISPSGKKINFGSYPFKNGTFIDHGDEKIRTAWRARHRSILKDGKPAYLNKESAEYYSWHLLW